MFDFDPATVRPEEIDRIIRQADRSLRDLTDAMERLGEVTGEGDAAGGMVRAVVDGEGMIQGVRFDPRVMRQDSETLAEAVVDAVRAAQGDARRKTAEVLGPVLGESPGDSLRNPSDGVRAEPSRGAEEQGARPTDRASDIERTRQRLERIQDSFLESMEGRMAGLERFRRRSG
ncbi:YbaB/EbfC family nucleoid-associated protein [Microtetraspora glauca]|uniref:YbaB/EbfC family nucleoid-associated protein n=1 Tax=Microtetraspora glauca TaxID=1996 RepID=A0ABV3G6R9_MICGL